LSNRRSACLLVEFADQYAELACGALVHEKATKGFVRRRLPPGFGIAVVPTRRGPASLGALVVSSSAAFLAVASPWSSIAVITCRVGAGGIGFNISIILNSANFSFGSVTQKPFVD
jgi:hypothetical protein